MGSCSTVEHPKPWRETPCIFSLPLSRAAGCNIYLKLENLQPSGSFKSRGIGNMMLQALGTRPASEVRFYISSGGNAGLACATSAASLGAAATVVVPTTTPQHVVGKLRDLGADVVIFGANWAAADAHLRNGPGLLASDPAGVYVPPFDHPDVWRGASTMVDEIWAQMDGEGRGVDGIVCNVGGGGLLVGIMEGVERVYGSGGGGNGGKTPPPPPTVLAIETDGADSLNASVRAGELVTLPGITSIASSLGATRVAARAFEWTQRAAPGGGKGRDTSSAMLRLVSAVVSDADAVMGSARFLDDARLLVEVACGATVSTVYNGDLRSHLGGGGGGLSDEEWGRRNVVLVVCGGSLLNLELLQEYKARYRV